MASVYEEKGWEKDKVMARANKKDKDRGGGGEIETAGLRIADTREETRGAPFLPSSPFRALMCPYGEFREKYKGLIPPLGKLDFFLPIG